MAEILQQWAQQGTLSQAKLSSDGTSLTLALDDGSNSSSTTVDASQECEISHQDKSCRYTLASLFLQILDPDQGLMAYRNACKAHNVADPVKVLDKPIVVGYILGGSSDVLPAAVGEAPPVALPTPVVAVEPAPVLVAVTEPTPAKPDKHKPTDRPHSSHHPSKRPSSSTSASTKPHRDKERPSDPSSSSRKHHHNRDHKEKDKRPRSSGSGEPDRTTMDKKKRKIPITNEQLFSNLNVVVDKRLNAVDGGGQEEEEEDQQEIHKALSAQGFDVTPELLQKHKATLDLILEIPVGDSASILRPIATVGRDFSRVLDLYLETIATVSTNSNGKNDASSKRKPNAPPPPSSSSSSDNKSYLIGKKPVIVLPKGMTCPITMLNALDFFGKATFVPRDVQLKRGVRNGGSTTPNTTNNTLTRTVGARSGGGQVEYEFMDNPKSKLGDDPREWQRIVAVIALGASWQFKDWPGKYSNPVHLFSRTFGFYIGMEGDKIPAELEGWAVRKGRLNRDKRGLDSVTHASFWNGLDEWMVVHKPELLPQKTL